MYNFKIRDIVRCPRAGKGDFKIIDLRKDEARIQSVDDPTKIQWIYLAHLSLNVKATVAAKRANQHTSEVAKILAKPKKKR